MSCHSRSPRLSPRVITGGTWGTLTVHTQVQGGFEEAEWRWSGRQRGRPGTASGSLAGGRGMLHGRR